MHPMSVVGGAAPRKYRFILTIVLARGRGVVYAVACQTGVPAACHTHHI